MTIEDTGAGIDPKFLPYVFERFCQAETAGNPKQGLGIGLAIVRSIVEAHGGTASVRSAGLGKGATFVISMPFVAQKSAAGPDHVRTSVVAEIDLAGIHALVVDDEPDACSLVRRVLEDAGAEVATAESADEALARLQSAVPDVLICDLGMPGKNGFDLIRAVRHPVDRPCSRVPAIALTAFARAEDRTRAMLSGYQVHLAKPVEAAELCAVVASLTGRARPTGSITPPDFSVAGADLGWGPSYVPTPRGSPRRPARSSPKAQSADEACRQATQRSSHASRFSQSKAIIPRTLRARRRADSD